MSANQTVLTGSSGLIGTSLVRSLQSKRISIIRLQREEAESTAANPRERWDPYAIKPMARPEALQGTTAAVHLSGANLSGGRWNAAYKQEIRESRVKPTHALAVLLAGLRPRPEVLVCASAIGIYGGRGDEELTEASSPGIGYLPEVCVAWEQAAQPASDAGIRVVHLRFGVVLSPRGGALGKMLPAFRAGLGGRLGDGRQWISWVALPDVIGAIEFALEQSSLAGPVNVVAPTPLTNADFTRALGRALHRPALLRVPAFALRLAFGEMAEATILQSERVVPTKLRASSFAFKYPEIDTCLAAILR